MAQPPELDLAPFIEGLLAKSGLSQRAIGRQLGFDASEVNGWVKGRRLPYLEAIWAIAELCSTTTAQAEALAGKLVRLTMAKRGRRRAPKTPD